MKLALSWMAGLMLLTACATMSVIDPPRSLLSDFQLTSITPDNLFFQGQLKLKNANPLTMNIQKIKLVISFNQKVNVIRVFDQLPSVLSFEVKQVVLPVRIRRDVLEGRLKGPMAVRCQAWIKTESQEGRKEVMEVDYETTLKLPDEPVLVPGRLLINKKGDRLAQEMTLSNPNNYPLTLERVLGHIRFDRYDYMMEALKAHVAIPPHQTIPLRLTAEKSGLIPQVKHARPQISLTFFTAGTKIVVPYTTTRSAD